MNKIVLLLFFIPLLSISCIGTQNMGQFELEKLLQKNKIKEIKVYQSENPEVPLNSENLIEIKTINTNGFVDSYKSINTFTQDTFVEKYFYNNKQQLTKSINYSDMYPATTTYEYDDKGKLIRMLVAEAESRDYSYTYNKNNQLTKIIGKTAYVGDDDKIVWSPVDSLIFTYNKDLKSSEQFYYLGDLYSNIKYEYNTQKQLTKSLQYSPDGELIRTTLHYYNEQKLNSHNEINNHYDNVILYEKIIYEE